VTAFDKPLIVYAALVYLLAMLAIGAWSYRRTRTQRDFFIAGQRVGIWVIALGTMSATFSGFVFLGGPGLTYRIGIASLFIVLPLGYTGGMLCWVVGRRLRALAGEREIFTVPDAFHARYGSRCVTGLAALAVLFGTTAYLGLQIQALGILLQSVFGTQSLALSMLVGLGVLVAYSVVGGMVAGAYTDLVQGVMMLVAAVAIFGQAVWVAGGWGSMVGSIAASAEFGTSFLEPLGRVPAFTAFGFFFVFGVGVLGQPQMLHKFYMLDDPAKLKWMPLVLSASQAVCVLVWLGIGLAVPSLVSQGRLGALANPDEAAPVFLVQFAEPVLAGLAVVAILAAIMSTADSFINIGSAALVRDLPRAIGIRVVNPLRWGRLAVLVVAATAALFAYSYGDLIAMLGTFAFGTFAAALAPALALGFNWTRVTPLAAGASILTGLVLNVVLELAARQSTWNWVPKPALAEGVLPSAVSLAASFSVLILVSMASGRRGERVVADDVRRLIEG
jgi:Na+/proline symporter